MNLNFSYRICAVIETEELKCLDRHNHIGAVRAAAEVYSSLIWKNGGQYALVPHFQLEETCRVNYELLKAPWKADDFDFARSACIFWDDCIPIPNELAEALLWKRELEDKSNETDHGAKSDPE